MRSTLSPRVAVFAGPNGAGKTTHAESILEALNIGTFVNADFIARGLSGARADAVSFEAGRIMLNRLRQLSAAREDFAFESTLSSRSFAPFLRDLKSNGYLVVIFYFSLASAALAVRRVSMRVKLGGHDVPQADIRRRYLRSLANFFELYAPLADEWVMLDNSGISRVRLVAGYDGNQLSVEDRTRWLKLQQQRIRR